MDTMGICKVDADTDPDHGCVSMMYAPINTGTSAVVEGIREGLGWEAEALRGYTTVAELDTHVALGLFKSGDLDPTPTNLARYGVTTEQLALEEAPFIPSALSVVFDGFDEAVPMTPSYHIQLNRTMLDIMYTDDPIGTDPLAQEVGKPDEFSGVALQLQALIDGQLASLITGTPVDLNVEVAALPNPSGGANGIVSSIMITIVIAMVAQSLWYVMFLAEDKHANLPAIRRLGVTEVQYWLNWFGILTVFGAVTALLDVLAAHLVGISPFDSVAATFWAQYLVFLFPSLFCVGFSLVVVALFNNPQTSFAVAFGLTFGSFGLVLVYYIIFDNSIFDPTISPPVVRAVMEFTSPVYMTCSLLESLYSILTRACVEDVLNCSTTLSLSDFWDAARYTSKHCSYQVSGEETCLYSVASVGTLLVAALWQYLVLGAIGVYIAHVRKGDGYRGLPLMFLFTPQFWLARSSQAGPPVDIKSLAVTYKTSRGASQKEVRALRGVDITVQPDTVTFLVGSNGAGKSTLSSVISGEVAPDPSTTGDTQVQVAGYDLRSPYSVRFLKKRVGLCPQHSTNVWLDLTCRQNLRVALAIRAFRGKGDSLSRKERRAATEAEIDRLLTAVDLADASNKKASQLSGGMIRRLSLLMATAGRPPLVVLDEPTTGLDPVTKRVIWRYIASLRCPESCVLVTSHDMTLVEKLADTVAVVEKGRVLAEGTPLELRHSLAGITATLWCESTGGVSDPRPLLESELGLLARQYGVECQLHLSSPNTVRFSFTKGGAGVGGIESQGFMPALAQYLSTHDSVTDFVLDRPSFTEYFLSVVGGVQEELSSVPSASTGPQQVGLTPLTKASESVGPSVPVDTVMETDQHPSLRQKFWTLIQLKATSVLVASGVTVPEPARVAVGITLTVVMFAVMSGIVVLAASLLVGTLEPSFQNTLQTAYDETWEAASAACEICCAMLYPSPPYTTEDMMTACRSDRPELCWAEGLDGYADGVCLAEAAYEGLDVQSPAVKTYPSGGTLSGMFGYTNAGPATLQVKNSANHPDLDSLLANGQVGEGTEVESMEVDPTWLSAHLGAFYAGIDSGVYPDPHGDVVPGVLPYMRPLYTTTTDSTCDEYVFVCVEECSTYWEPYHEYHDTTASSGFDISACEDTCKRDSVEWQRDSCDTTADTEYIHTALRTPLIECDMEEYLSEFHENSVYQNIYDSGLQYSAENAGSGSAVFLADMGPIGVVDFFGYTVSETRPALSYTLHSYLPWFLSDTNYNTRHHTVHMQNTAGITSFNTKTGRTTNPPSFSSRVRIPTGMVVEDGKDSEVLLRLPSSPRPTLSGIASDLVARLDEAWLRSLVNTKYPGTGMDFSLSVSVSSYPYMLDPTLETGSYSLMKVVTVFIVPLALLLLVPFPAIHIISAAEQAPLLSYHGVGRTLSHVVSLLWWVCVALVAAVVAIAAGYTLGLPGFEHGSDSLTMFAVTFGVGVAAVVSFSFLVGTVADSVKAASIATSVFTLIFFSIGFYIEAIPPLGVAPILAFIIDMRLAFTTTDATKMLSDTLSMNLVSLFASAVCLGLSFYLLPRVKVTKGREREMQQGEVLEPCCHEERLALDVKGIEYQYPKGTRALNGVNLGVRDKETVALLGASGSGKTTLANVVTGHLSALAGTALLSTGTDLTQHPRDAWQHISIMPQHDCVWPFLTVEQHLYTIARIRGLQTSPGVTLTEVVEGLLSLTMLTTHRYKRSGELSGGMRRRLSLCMAILGTSTHGVLLTDEPTTGLDPLTKRSVWSAILNTDSTLLLNTHDMGEAETLAHSAAIMVRGTVVTVGSPGGLRQQCSTPTILVLEGVSDGYQTERDIRQLGVAVDSVRVSPQSDGLYSVEVAFSHGHDPVALYTYVSTLPKGVIWTVRVPRLEDAFLEIVSREMERESTSVSM
ncbi:ABC transporter A, ABCA [Kipferlia bialata]|uniref:ABC transporter A, ABCA n=1 Tax=Kipferlia bialata TaxID=797122 RepID=A0A9K3CUE0_9EUKA|nr:ABC transporter A, ABCA [Kipferlia bialata]|eukprot:g4833.t1